MLEMPRLVGGPGEFCNTGWERRSAEDRVFPHGLGLRTGGCVSPFSRSLVEGAGPRLPSSDSLLPASTALCVLTRRPRQGGRWEGPQSHREADWAGERGLGMQGLPDRIFSPSIRTVPLSPPKPNNG